MVVVPADALIQMALPSIKPSDGAIVMSGRMPAEAVRFVPESADGAVDPGNDLMMTVLALVLRMYSHDQRYLPDRVASRARSEWSVCQPFAAVIVACSID